MTRPAKAGGWARLRAETGLPPDAPRWFVGLRFASKSLIYGIALAWIGYVPTSQPWQGLIWALVAVLWVVIIAATIIDVRHRRRTESSRFARASDISMALAPIPILLGIPLLGLALLVAGYVLQLRRVSGGRVFIFAIVGSTVALVLATIALFGVEAKESGSTLGTPQAAASYSVSTILQLSSADDITPSSDQGRIIASALQVMSAIFIGAIYGGLLTMVVRDANDDEVNDIRERLDRLSAQQDAILARLDALVAPPRTDESRDA